MTRPWSVIWDVYFLKNFFNNWSASTSRTLPSISLFRNARHRKTNYVLLLSILANSCHGCPQPSVKVNQQHTFTRTQAVILVISSKPATLDANAIDLTRFNLTAKEKECRRTKGLCFYYGQAGHQTFSCLIKPANWHVRTIQDIQHTPAAQPTSNSPQDLRNK